MVLIGRLHKCTTLKFYVLHSKVHSLSQTLSICDSILSPKSIFLLSFLGEHLVFLQDFNNLMVSIGRLDEYRTLKFYVLHSKVYPNGQKSRIFDWGLGWSFWWCGSHRDPPLLSSTHQWL